MLSPRKRKPIDRKRPDRQPACRTRRAGVFPGNEEKLMKSSRLLGTGIGARLGGAFAALLVLLLGCAGIGVAQLRSLQQSLLNVEDRSHAGVLAAGLVAQAHQTSGALGRAVMSDGLEGIQSNLKLADNVAGEGKASMQALTELSHGEVMALKEVQAAEGPYRAVIGKVAAAIKGGDSDAARLALNNTTTLAAEAAYLGALERLNVEQRKAAVAAKQ